MAGDGAIWGSLRHVSRLSGSRDRQSPQGGGGWCSSRDAAANERCHSSNEPVLAKWARFDDHLVAENRGSRPCPGTEPFTHSLSETEWTTVRASPGRRLRELLRTPHGDPGQPADAGGRTD